MKKYLDFWRESLGIVHNFITTPNFKKTFIYGIVLYALALFALIRGGVYYIDDWNSSVNDISWSHFSRYLATLIFNVLATFGKKSMDMSPLFQIMGVCFLVISAMILIYLIRKKFDFIGIVASLPLGLSPHFLQNLSYKFESLIMAMAILFAILPFLFKEKMRVFCVISIISLLCMLMCYQAASGAYIVVGVYFAFSMFFVDGRSLKDSAIFLSICAMNLIIASLLYGLILNPFPMQINAYSSQQMISLNLYFFAELWVNLSTYLNTLFSDFKQTPYIWLVALVSACFIVGVAIRTNRPKIYAIFGAMIFIVLGICLSFGLYLILKKPLFEPRAFMGFGVFVALITITNVSFISHINSALDLSKSTALPRLQKITHYISCIVAVIMAYFLISFANIYGNALTKQDEYWDFRVKLLLKDLGDVIPKNANAMISLKIDSNQNHAVTQRFMDKYGNIGRAIIHEFEYSWFVFRISYLGFSYSIDYEFCDFIKGQFGSEVVFKNRYHTIERAKTCYIVTLNK